MWASFSELALLTWIAELWPVAGRWPAVQFWMFWSSWSEEQRLHRSINTEEHVWPASVMWLPGQACALCMHTFALGWNSLEESGHTGDFRAPHTDLQLILFKLLHLVFRMLLLATARRKCSVLNLKRCSATRTHVLQERQNGGEQLCWVVKVPNGGEKPEEPEAPQLIRLGGPQTSLSIWVWKDQTQLEPGPWAWPLSTPRSRTMPSTDRERQRESVCVWWSGAVGVPRCSGSSSDVHTCEGLQSCFLNSIFYGFCRHFVVGIKTLKEILWLQCLSLDCFTIERKKEIILDIWFWILH